MAKMAIPNMSGSMINPTNPGAKEIKMAKMIIFPSLISFFCG
jgi:hypothetical protein